MNSLPPEIPTGATQRFHFSILYWTNSDMLHSCLHFSLLFYVNHIFPQRLWKNNGALSRQNSSAHSSPTWVLSLPWGECLLGLRISLCRAEKTRPTNKAVHRACVSDDNIADMCHMPLSLLLLLQLTFKFRNIPESWGHYSGIILMAGHVWYSVI